MKQSIVTEKIVYTQDQHTLESFLAFPDAIPKDRCPVVLIAHAWGGRDSFVEEKAKLFAEMGYLGVALDVYGQGIVPKTQEARMAAMQPLLQDRAQLTARLMAGITNIAQHKAANTQKMAAIGYCFGGLCVLDLARANAPLAGVVSLHGLLHAPSGATHSPIHPKVIHPKVLVLHGHQDPMVPPEAVATFEKEMLAAHADWQIHIYGQALHAFTNPEAQDPKLGTVYHPASDQRATRILTDFLKELF